MVKNVSLAGPRFFAPNLDPATSSVTLPPEESKHLTRVLRLRAGDEVAVFDGRGREFMARVERANPRAAVVSLVTPTAPAPEPFIAFTLAQALLKGPAMDDVVRDATMMGAAAIHPIMTRRVVARTSGAGAGSLAVRWHRIAVASAKQCRRAIVPVIAEPRPMSAWLRDAMCELKLLFTEPGAGAEPISLKSLAGRKAPASAALLIGPEGGWMPEEIAAARDAGCLPVSLGPQTLRADAAPIAAIAVFRFLWEG